MQLIFIFHLFDKKSRDRAAISLFEVQYKQITERTVKNY